MMLWSFLLLITAVLLVNSDDISDNPPYKERKMTASDMLRAFNAPSKQLRQLANQQVSANEALLSKLGGNSDLLRELEELELFQRAGSDPVCAMNIDCSDVTNRNFVDGQEFENMNAMCNNLDTFSWGMARTQHRRIVENAYDNGRWKPRANSVTGTNRNPVPLPNPRTISTAVHSASSNKPEDDNGRSLALFYFLQFIDHDITKTAEGEVPGNRKCCVSDHRFCGKIVVEEADDGFPAGYCMEFRRSFVVSGGCTPDVRFNNQLNELTVYLDASMVYGSSDEEMHELRSGIGGFLRTSTHNFCPEAEHPEEQTCRTQAPDICFLTGDTRANVHPGLTTMHTLFVREHNRIAGILGDINPEWSDDRLFFETRKIIAAFIQRIVFNDMLPRILDESVMRQYGLLDRYQYDSGADATVIQAFAIAYRYHHMMPSSMRRSQERGRRVVDRDAVNQEEVFMQPGFLLDDNYNGIDELTLGLAANRCPFSDRRVNNAARNLLFVDDNGDAFDLVALNIERGRDWGTPAYTQYRALCGVGNVTSWNDLASTHSEDNIQRLQSVYADPRDIDLWTGVVTETPIGTSNSGPTQSCIVATQFALLRNGDRFWYESRNTDVSFKQPQINQIERVSLAAIMCNNMEVTRMRTDVFDTNSEWIDCDDLQQLDFGAWRER